MPDTQPADTDALPLIRLFEGDSLDVLRTIPDHTYTAVVTDPPYGLSAAPSPWDVLAQWLVDGDFVRTGGRKKAPPPGLSELAARFQSTAGGGGFLGHSWDAFVPGPRLWREVFRVCKPGAIVLCFAATRTDHWMKLSLALAGFEILDTIGWITSQGMAKAGTVDKRIDRRRHDRDQVLACTAWIRRRCDELGLKPADLDAACGTAGMGGHWVSSKSQPYVPTREQWTKLEPLLGPMPPEIDAQRMIIDARQPGPDHFKRAVLGEHPAPSSNDPDANAAAVGPRAIDGPLMITAPATDLSGEWAGWSTQLGPALEPIIVARRPCEGTAVENILRHGCGAMNIDACRIGNESTRRHNTADMGYAGGLLAAGSGYETGSDVGRWPKNAMFCEESAAVLNAQVGERKSGSRRAGTRSGMGFRGADGDGGPAIEGSSGDASRFFTVISADVADAPLAGRWPKNVMFSGESAEILDALVPHSRDGVAVKRNTPVGKVTGQIFRRGNTGVDAGYGGEGGVSRFFWVGPLATDDDVALPVRYVPKASRRERNAGLPPGAKGDHPTKKPRKLMEWLCRLAGHPKGRILDPFAGSGSTLAAARAMGLPCDGVERDEHYCRDLAAPTAGVDPADVVRVPPPDDGDRPLDAAARVPYYETVRSPRPPVIFPITYQPPDEDGWVVAECPSIPGCVSQGRTREEAAENIAEAIAVSLEEDAPPPVPSLEIPAPAQADASYGLPPMFPRLPGAPEVP